MCSFSEPQLLVQSKKYKATCQMGRSGIQKGMVARTLNKWEPVTFSEHSVLWISGVELAGEFRDVKAVEWGHLSWHIRSSSENV